MNTTIHHRSIKMKPIDVKDNTYINIGKEINDKDPKFKIGDHVRISKSKNIFAKGYTPNCSSMDININDLNGEEIVGTFYKKNCKRSIKKNLE